MSDPLDPNPGNLRKHRVFPEFDHKMDSPFTPIIHAFAQDIQAMASCEKGPDYEHQPDPPPYPPKEEQRAPLLSGGNLTHVAGCDLTFNGVLPEPMLSISNARLDGAQRVADWYEAKIREGVLIINPDYKP